MENQATVEPQNNNYYQQPRKKSGWFGKLLLSCVGLFLIFACACSGFFVITSLGVMGGSTAITVDEEVAYDAGNSKSLTTTKLAVIDIVGAISYVIPNQGAVSADANNETIIAQLKKAKDDSEVKAVLLRFNTPGGAVAAAEPICREIQATAEKKPVYSYIDTEGASLGYLLPNCTSFIYSRPESITGSIGVIASLSDYNGIIEKLGGKTISITNKAGVEKTGEGLFDKNSTEYKRFQSMLDESYEYFVGKVWAGRKGKGKLTEAKLRELADGRVFSGKQALDAGLVDKNLYFEDVVSDILSRESSTFGDSKVEVVVYTLPTSPFSGIFGAMHSISKMTTSEGSINTRKMELLYLSQM